GENFNVSSYVAGFTEANSNQIVIGFNTLDENNSLFLGGRQAASVSGIAVDGSGASQATLIALGAPATPGTFLLHAWALYAKETSTLFYYLGESVSVLVTESAPDPNASTDIVTYKVTQKTPKLSDGSLDELWETIPLYYVSEFGSGGYIKSIHNGYYIYSLLAYEKSMNWISIEFDALLGQENHMLRGNDAWSFGQGLQTNYVGDGYFVGASGEPLADARNDIFFETFADDTLAYVELVRLLDTQDSVGKDIVFNTATIFNIQFASNIAHVTSHKIHTWSLSTKGPTNATATVIPPGQIVGPTMTEISDIVFVFSVTMVFFTAAIHATLRVISKPIKHERRIVHTDKLPNQPSLRQAIRSWRTKPKVKEPEA
ncbi:MAG TPA: hypothetical protein VJ044_08610, partial [Candidatus Hodarchaeales archaeon]|nr:hypothetical protein [Candidatus Hodarchaeales archaeon]